MSSVNKGRLVLGAVIAGVAGVISVVHWQQVRDKVEMKKGIERDKIRVAEKSKLQER